MRYRVALVFDMDYDGEPGTTVQDVRDSMLYDPEAWFEFSDADLIAIGVWEFGEDSTGPSNVDEFIASLSS